MANHKLSLAIIFIAFLLQISGSVIAMRPQSLEYGVAKMDDEIASTVNGGSTCGSTAQGGTVQLSCLFGSKISKITFASFGNPKGSCGSFIKGTCDAPNTLAVVQRACLGKESCTVIASEAQLGVAPCGGIKTLAVEAIC